MNAESSSTSRRSFLARAAGAALLATAGDATSALGAVMPTRKSFPKNFRWGVATAGHQIEGNNVNSDMWLIENIKPAAFADRSGDACNSYHRYEEDIALLAQLGFNA
jgi:beta-glucosidase